MGIDINAFKNNKNNKYGKNSNLFEGGSGGGIPGILQKKYEDPRGITDVKKL